MSLDQSRPTKRYCFIYCGDDRCDCEAAPRFRDGAFFDLHDETREMTESPFKKPRLVDAKNNNK